MALRWARFADLDPTTLYAILQLRAEVFVVEQGCRYQDLDGLDCKPDTWHCWIEQDGEVLSYLRVLSLLEGGSKIGRVVTAAHARRRGHAAEVVRFALEQLTAPPVVIHAQAHLERWYSRFGFVREGLEFMEAGIPHVRMYRNTSGS